MQQHAKQCVYTTGSFQRTERGWTNAVTLPDNTKEPARATSLRTLRRPSQSGAHRDSHKAKTSPEDAERPAAPRAGPRPRLAARSQARRARAADTPGAGRSAKAGPRAESAHENAQGLARKTSLQSLQRSSRDGEGGPKPIKTRKGPQGDDSPCGPSARAAHSARPRARDRAQKEKRPPRARRPALPQPCAAVLSAKAGLTAGFGMGPGDPRLCGRARGGRSPAALLYSSLPGTPSPGRPWRPHGGHGSKNTHRARCFIEDAKSSGY